MVWQRIAASSCHSIPDLWQFWEGWEKKREDRSSSFGALEKGRVCFFSRAEKRPGGPPLSVFTPRHLHTKAQEHEDPLSVLHRKVQPSRQPVVKTKKSKHKCLWERDFEKDIKILWKSFFFFFASPRLKETLPTDWEHFIFCVPFRVDKNRKHKRIIAIIIIVTVIENSSQQFLGPAAASPHLSTRFLDLHRAENTQMWCEFFLNSLVRQFCEGPGRGRDRNKFQRSSAEPQK